MKPLKPKKEESGSPKPRRPRKGSRREPVPRAALPGKPLIVAREDHPISKKRIDEDALKVLYRLNRNGFQAYIVGGGVRDLYLGKEPKDFDIATNALPDEVRSLFRNSRIIGRRFKLNHIYFRGGKIIELATFRSNEEDSSAAEEMLKSDNTWGTAETDAFRRDITINALFYDVDSGSIIDYVNGIEDLDRGIVRFIGDPRIRVQEDPVRMIRTLRHAGRVGFIVEGETYDAVCEFPALLKHCPGARLYEELLKDLRSGAARAVLPLYREAGLLKYMTPSLHHFADRKVQVWQRMLQAASLIDKHVMKWKARNDSAEVPPSILVSALFLGNIPDEALEFEELSESESIALRSIWELEPFLEGSDADAELMDEGGLDLSDEVRVCHRKVIEKLLRPVGVSKKDCEYIERMLFLRICMFEVFAGGQDDRLPHLDAFADSLLLLSLTSHSAWSEDNYEFWDSQRAKYVKKRKPDRRYR